MYCPFKYCNHSEYFNFNSNLCPIIFSGCKVVSLDSIQIHSYLLNMVHAKLVKSLSFNIVALPCIQTYPSDLNKFSITRALFDDKHYKYNSIHRKRWHYFGHPT